MIEPESVIPKYWRHVSYPNTKIDAIRYIDTYPCRRTITDREYHELNGILDLFLRSWVRDIEYGCHIPSIGINYDYTTDVATKSYERENITICQNYKFAVQLINISFSNDPDPDESTHANALFINNTSKTGELFEPNGTEAPWYDAVESMIQHELDLYGYKLIPATEICPDIGPQAISGRAICATFSKFYVWSRLHQPDLEPSQLIFELMFGYGSGPHGVIQNLSESINNGASDIGELMTKFMCFEYDYAISNNLFRLKRLQDETFKKLNILNNEYLNLRRTYGSSRCILELKQFLLKISTLSDMIVNDIDNLDYDSANKKYQQFNMDYDQCMNLSHQCVAHLSK
jgi:hypothetical protein